MDYLAAIRRDSDRFYATADGADPALPVPSCPDWTVADLVLHLANVHWFWGTDIETRASGPDEIEHAKPKPLTRYEDVVAGAAPRRSRMIHLLETVPDDVPVWTWALDDADHTVGFIRRHQVQEAAVHRWDIQAATGSARTHRTRRGRRLDRRGACHHAPVGRPRRRSRSPAASTSTALTPKANGSSTPRGGSSPSHAKGDVAIRGTASTCCSASTPVCPILGDLDVFGDQTLAQERIDRLNTT